VRTKKNPLVMVSAVAFLVMVVILLIATATASADKPLTQISYSSDSNNFVPQKGFQAGSSLLLQEYEGDYLTGHMLNYYPQGLLAGGRAVSAPCTDASLGPLGEQFWDLTITGESYGAKAEFYVWMKTVSQPRTGFLLPDEYPLRVVVIDGGQPSLQTDYQQVYFFGVPSLMPAIGPEGTAPIPSGNVVIHW
jgi:hypothetical protein